LIILFLTGIAAGLFGGYLGIGGGVIMVPVLVELLQSEGVGSEHLFHLAFGTSLLAAVAMTGMATLSYSRVKRVAWRAVLWVAIPAAGMSLVGSYLAALSDTRLLKTAFFLFLIISAILLIRGKHAPSDTQDNLRHHALIVTGLLAGIVSAYLGVAGGVVMVPLFLIWAHLPAEKAPGTSAAAGIITTSIGAFGYILNGISAQGLPAGAWGYVLPAYAAPMMLGAVIGAPAGTYLNHRFGTKIFRYVFAVFLLFVATRLLLRSM
jgi:uncharacterized membrane protein YfcA